MSGLVQITVTSACWILCGGTKAVERRLHHDIVIERRNLEIWYQSSKMCSFYFEPDTRKTVSLSNSVNSDIGNYYSSRV
jgi:hypothetical protein